ncbi:uncharacterized protein LOC122519049 [Polistes fuscatus]|uniref:uncharacterized protein LOC122519049 n=1 Tax=Polistes fuscatus TaxID=30207 RepID=UPI001CA9BCAF|nr:uncharacterized protein LOC122519049 [Polistes fuscatus]
MALIPGGSPLAAILVSKDGGTCSLVRRGLFFVAAKWGDSLVVSVYFPPSEDISKFCRLLDELEELLGSFPTLPALVAGDFNARSHRWDPEGRSNLRGELLCMWANRSNLSLGNQVGHPTCVRPQGSSVIDLTWGSPTAIVRLSDWRVDEAESLSDHLYIIFNYRREATGFRSLCSRERIFPRWDARAVDEDRLAAALVSADWTRDHGASGEDLVWWIRHALTGACDISMSRLGSTRCQERAVSWWSSELSTLRRVATTTRRRYQRVRRSGDPARVHECLESRREAKRGFGPCYQKGQGFGLEGLPHYHRGRSLGRPYKLVMNKLRARGLPPLTEALDPSFLMRIVTTLFPGGDQLIAPNINLVDLDEIIVTIEEVREAALRIGLGRAPGPDGIPGLVIKRAAIYCGRGLARFLLCC